MPTETRWRVTLDNRASRNAVKLTRDVRELAKALRELKEAGAGIDLGGLGGAGGAGRRSGGGGGGRRGPDEEARRARAAAKRARDDARTADRVRRATERAQGQNARREARDAARAQRDGDRSRRGRERADERSLRLGFSDAGGRRAAFRARDRAAARSARAEERGASVRQRTLRREAAEQRETVSAGLGGAASTLGAIVAATTAAAAAVAGIVTGVGALIFRLSSAVLEMIALREASLTTLRALARDDQGNHLTGAAADAQARERFRFAQTFARQTSLDSAQVIDLQRQTSAAGFNGDRNNEVVRAAADVGAFNPADDGASSRFLLGLGQLHNASTVRTQDVRQTAEAAGLGENDILRQIARGAGVTQRTGEADAAYNGRIQAMQRAGRFTGRQGEEGVLAALRERNGGELGSFARQQGGTLTGTISNLRGAVLDFVTSIEDIENLPGIKALKKMLNSIVDVLTGTGPVATRLRTIFAGLVDEAAQFVGDLGGKDGVEGIITHAVDLFERWAPLVRDVVAAFGGGAWEAFSAGMRELGVELSAIGDDPEGTVVFARELGSALGTLLAFGVRVIAMVMSLVAMITLLGAVFVHPIDSLYALVEAFTAVGGQIVSGFLGGFRGAADAALGEVSTWATDLAGAARGALGIQSPSRVFRDEIGAQIPAGMTLGIESGAADVRRSMESMVSPAGLPGFGGEGAAEGGGQTVLNVHPGAIVVQGTGRGAADIADEVLDRLVGMFERPALAGGA